MIGATGIIARKVEEEDCSHRPAEEPCKYTNWNEDQEHSSVATEEGPPHCTGEMLPELCRWSPSVSRAGILAGWLVGISEARR